MPTLEQTEAAVIWRMLIASSDRGSDAWCRRLSAWVNRGGATQRWHDPVAGIATALGVPVETVEGWLSRR